MNNEHSISECFKIAQNSAANKKRKTCISLFSISSDREKLTNNISITISERLKEL